jgi:hypothetical protein
VHQLNLNINPADFIDKDILELLNLQNAPEEKKAEIIKDMLATIQNRVLARLLDNLDEAEINALEVLIDNQQEKDVEDFLLKKDFDVKKVAAEESLNYKVEIINLIKAKKVE